MRGLRICAVVVLHGKCVNPGRHPHIVEVGGGLNGVHEWEPAMTRLLTLVQQLSGQVIHNVVPAEVTIAVRVPVSGADLIVVLGARDRISSSVPECTHLKGGRTHTLG